MIKASRVACRGGELNCRVLIDIRSRVPLILWVLFLFLIFSGLFFLVWFAVWHHDKEHQDKGFLSGNTVIYHTIVPFATTNVTLLSTLSNSSNKQQFICLIYTTINIFPPLA